MSFSYNTVCIEYVFKLTCFYGNFVAFYIYSCRFSYHFRNVITYNAKPDFIACLKVTDFNTL